MTPYHKFVQDIALLNETGKTFPLGGFEPPAAPALADDAPKVLIFSPHPDDECIIGGVALRLMREAGMRVINVAVTQGSNPERQAGRLEELRAACDYLGFDLLQTSETGLRNVKTSARNASPEQWQGNVKIIAGILQANQPKAILFPHDDDWNSTHIGVHHLVMDALATLPQDLSTYLLETEFWGAMDNPNLMVECGTNDLGDLLAALSFHVGEVKRNPYHLLTPAWMKDNVRRGGELVCGQGEAPPAYLFATNYRLRKWLNGKAEHFYEGGRLLACDDDPNSLFE